MNKFYEELPPIWYPDIEFQSRFRHERLAMTDSTKEPWQSGNYLQAKQRADRKPIELAPNQTSMNSEEGWVSKQTLFDHMIKYNIPAFVVHSDSVDMTYCREDDGSFSCFNNLGFGVERFKREDGKYEYWLEHTSFEMLPSEVREIAKKYSGNNWIHSYYG